MMQFYDQVKWNNKTWFEVWLAKMFKKKKGRMDQVLYVGLPDLEDRREIIQVIRQRMTTDAGLDVDALARQTEFCTGADIDQIFR